MPARRKSLPELVRDGTFLARRHADRLHEPLGLPEPPDLRALQAAYLAELDEASRRAIAFAFESAVRSGARMPKRQLTVAQRWYAGFGAWTGLDALGFRRSDGTIDWDGFERLERRWIYWDRRHGCWWRAKHTMLNAVDREKLVGVLTGRQVQLVNVAAAELAQLEDELAALVAARNPPDPPGLELLTART